MVLSPDDFKCFELVSPATNIQSVTHTKANNTQHCHNAVNMIKQQIMQHKTQCRLFLIKLNKCNILPFLLS